VYRTDHLPRPRGSAFGETPADAQQLANLLADVALQRHTLIMADGHAAAAEFQKIVGQKVLSWGAPYPQAPVGLARAAAQASDIAEARKLYSDLFAL
jgi:hypothetical protein